jgi:hypothetical protein
MRAENSAFIVGAAIKFAMCRVERIKVASALGYCKEAEVTS